MRTLHTSIERHGVPIPVSIEFTEFPYVQIHSVEDRNGVDLYGSLTTSEQDDMLTACEAATGRIELYSLPYATAGTRWA